MPFAPCARSAAGQQRVIIIISVAFAAVPICLSPLSGKVCVLLLRSFTLLFIGGILGEVKGHTAISRFVYLHVVPVPPLNSLPVGALQNPINRFK